MTSGPSPAGGESSNQAAHQQTSSSSSSDPTSQAAPEPVILGDTSPGPFEGPEKLLEVWFAPSPHTLPRGEAASLNRPGKSRPLRGDEDAVGGSRRGDESGSAGKVTDGVVEWQGLRAVPRSVWEEMLAVVKCQVLSVIEGSEVDAYLLSESSLFVAPHVVILKTCGTTINLLGLERIIEIAKTWCGLGEVHRCFYSRKSFFFPERQVGVHRDWQQEVGFLDSVFPGKGMAYTVGPMNGDHWLLYLTGAETTASASANGSMETERLGLERPNSLPALPSMLTKKPPQDSTLEILMTHLSANARAPFFHPEEIDPSCSERVVPASAPSSSAASASPALVRSGHHLGQVLTSHLKIDQLFPSSETTIDSFGFEPCGYSANAIIGSGSNNVVDREESGGGGYFTIHVTPEEGWSFASFECNVPLPCAPPSSSSSSNDHNATADAKANGRPDLTTLIRKVIDIFEPGRLSITLFLSTSESEAEDSPHGNAQEEAVSRHAWSTFSTDLLGEGYVRKDRIGYEFEGYDLVFACFEKNGLKEVKKIAI